MVDEEAWVRRMAKIEDETGGFIAAGPTPYNLALEQIVRAIKRTQTFMPVMDCRTVSSLRKGATGWVVKRAITGGKIGPLINGNAHIYPAQQEGVPVKIERDTVGVLRAWVVGESVYHHYIGIVQIAEEVK